MDTSEGQFIGNDGVLSCVSKSAQKLKLKVKIYGGPQVHTEFQKVTPNSNNSHRIQITHTESHTEFK